MSDYSISGVEPRLHEILDDPIVQLVMRRDGVRREDLIHLSVRARPRLRAPTVSAPAVSSGVSLRDSSQPQGPSPSRPLPPAPSLHPSPLGARWAAVRPVALIRRARLRITDHV